MALKIKPEHLAILREAIKPLDTAERRLQYRNRLFPRADKCRDVNKRYRWDLLWAAGIRFGAASKSLDMHTLYEYLNDSHIDAALRSLVTDLE